MTIRVRGIRGATTVTANTPEALFDATRELLTGMVEANGIAIDDIGSVLFSATADLNAAFPAAAARQLGWTDVPLLCFHEMEVPEALPLCLRVLIHWNTERPAADIRHVYLRGARALRPDLAHSD